MGAGCITLMVMVVVLVSAGGITLVLVVVVFMVGGVILLQKNHASTDHQHDMGIQLQAAQHGVTTIAKQNDLPIDYSGSACLLHAVYRWAQMGKRQQSRGVLCQVGLQLVDCSSLPYQELWVHVQQPVQAECCDAQDFLEVHPCVLALNHLGTAVDTLQP